MARPEEPLYYKIGEAAARVGVPSHVIRFWTRSFPQINPSRLKGRHRLYSSGDVRLFVEIKRLLYEERFTIEGARRRLTETPPPKSFGRDLAARLDSSAFKATDDLSGPLGEEASSLESIGPAEEKSGPEAMDPAAKGKAKSPARKSPAAKSPARKSPSPKDPARKIGASPAPDAALRDNQLLANIKRELMELRELLTGLPASPKAVREALKMGPGNLDGAKNAGEGS
jgi:DNA-binding transcriptional MerR regulator